MSATESDPVLRRLERRALWFCVLAALVAVGLRRGHLDLALGILGGGVLSGLSYWAIRSSIDGVLAIALGGGTGPAEAPPPASRVDRLRRGAGYVLRFTGRYLVLGALAYVMLVVARLHPLGMIIGVSALVVAAAIEAAAWVLAPRP